MGENLAFEQLDVKQESSATPTMVLTRYSVKANAIVKLCRIARQRCSAARHDALKWEDRRRKELASKTLEPGVNVTGPQLNSLVRRRKVSNFKIHPYSEIVCP